MLKLTQLLFVTIIISACSNNQSVSPKIGRFNSDSDLFIANFDCKTDVDDLHSIAGVFTILSNPKFSHVKFHAVAGAYGVQDGLYVPAEELFDEAFKANWSDAHSNFNEAMIRVSGIAEKTLKGGGKIWIAEAGQSDFSAALVKNLKHNNPDIDTKNHVFIVQHSEWNEKVTSVEALNYVKNNSTYIKIPDGNVTGNGTPGFRSSKQFDLKQYTTNPEILKIWNLAIQTANKYNGQEDRYLNQSIADGGLDFSDVSETCWIFGYEKIADADQFFKEFLVTFNEN